MRREKKDKTLKKMDVVSVMFLEKNVETSNNLGAAKNYDNAIQQIESFHLPTLLNT